jgi:hypothetical protein
LNNYYPQTKLKIKYRDFGKNITDNFNYVKISNQDRSKFLADDNTILACNIFRNTYGLRKVDYAFCNCFRILAISHYLKRKRDIIHLALKTDFDSCPERKTEEIDSLRYELDEIYRNVFNCFDKKVAELRNNANGMYFHNEHGLEQEICKYHCNIFINNLLANLDFSYEFEEDVLSYKKKNSEQFYCDQYYYTNEIQEKAHNILLNQQYDFDMLIDLVNTTYNIIQVCDKKAKELNQSLKDVLSKEYTKKHKKNNDWKDSVNEQIKDDLLKLKKDS